MQIEGFAVRRREVDLEVAGVDDDTDRRINGQRNAVDQAVRHADGLNGKRPKRKLSAGSDLDQLRVIEHLVLFELAFHISKGELGAVYGHVQLGEDPGQAADVVFVAVGEDDSAHMVAVLDEVGDVGDDDVDTEQLGFGEHQPGIDDEDVVFVAEGEAVHAELAQSAEGNDL